MEQEMLKLILVEIREMKGDISELKDNVKSIDSRLTHVENDMSEVKEDMSKTKKDVKTLKEMAEFQTENINAIKNVVTSNYMEFKKFVKANDRQHNLYNAKLLKFDKEK